MSVFAYLRLNVRNKCLVLKAMTTSPTPDVHPTVHSFVSLSLGFVLKERPKKKKQQKKTL